LDNHRSFAHGRGDTLHALSPDIANCEHSGKARFEQIRSTAERPDVLNLCAGLDEAPFALRRKIALALIDLQKG
jgi:hypothetical protein